MTAGIGDDAGTRFTLIGRSSGGHAGEAALYCEWVFTPAMPESAGTLTVTFATDGGATSSSTFYRLS